jgi:membrane protease YdiL (CAAX protease family)
LTQFLSGGAVGIGSRVLVFIVLWTLGFFSITATNKAPTVSEDIMFHAFFEFLPAVVFFAILLRILENNFGTWISIGLASVIFGFQHLLYPGQTILSASAQTNEGGILFCSLSVLTRRIWSIFGFMFAWDYIQCAIVGFPVKEISRPLLVAQFSGPSILTGYPVGLEASLLRFAAGTGLGLVFLRQAFAQKRFIRPSWKAISGEI